jgi:glycosyltransferase involved in cell wall biosynthesis
MLLSVIITNYNYARYIERSIRSVFNQSLPKDQYEIIVVDDSSKDESIKVLNNYLQEIRLISFKRNRGLSAARNEGIKKAKGQFVFFLDSDDYIHKDLLKIETLFLTENNFINAVSVDYFLVDEYGNHVKHVDASKKPIACGIMFRKDLLFDIGLYDESFRAREEEDLRIRFLKKYNIHNINLPLYRYRMHDSNLTKNVAEMYKYKQKLTGKHKRKK